MLTISSAPGFDIWPYTAQDACQGGVFKFKMPGQPLAAYIIWQLQPPHPLSHYFFHFSGLNWANPKKAAVLFRWFSAVNDPFFLLDESRILL